MINASPYRSNARPELGTIGQALVEFLGSQWRVEQVNVYESGGGFIDLRANSERFHVRLWIEGKSIDTIAANADPGAYFQGLVEEWEDLMLGFRKPHRYRFQGARCQAPKMPADKACGEVIP